MFIFVIIPFFLLLAINFRVLHVIKKKGSTNPSANSSNPHRRAVNNVRKVKGNLACFVVVLVSVLCWLPRVFHNISLLFPREDLVSPILIQLSLFFLFLQSSLNPFIYSFYRAEFRQAAIRLLGCKNSSDDVISIVMVSTRKLTKQWFNEEGCHVWWL